MSVDAAALVARLQAHSHDADVQAECCQALWRSSQLPEGSALTFVPAVVAALRAHPDHAELQQSGCVALGRIFQGKAVGSIPGAADGTRALVDAMRRHPANAELQCMCCGALDVSTRRAA